RARIPTYTYRTQITRTIRVHFEQYVAGCGGRPVGDISGNSPGALKEGVGRRGRGHSGCDKHVVKGFFGAAAHEDAVRYEPKYRVDVCSRGKRMNDISVPARRD